MSEPNQLFPTTQWGIVIEAQGTPTPNARQALEQTVSGSERQFVKHPSFIGFS
jgi:hypothetical protein